MEWWLWVLIAVLVVAAVAAVAIVVAVRKQRQRTARLRERFGPEYDRAVEGGRRTGETELEERLQRRRRLPLSPPGQDERTRFEREWSEIEGQFEEAELPAVARADALATTILAASGYPMDSFEQRAADLSVDYPEEVGHYRRAHEAFRRADEGKATHEDLYEALQHYRALLDALLATDAPAGDRVSDDPRPQRPPTPVEPAG
jgi:hypothetical protein